MVEKVKTGIVPKKEHLKELTKEQKAQKKRDDSFEEMIVQFHKNKGEDITKKEAHEFRLNLIKKSEKVKQNIYDQVRYGSMEYRKSQGILTPELYEGGLDETVTYPIPEGDERITEKSKFRVEERPLEFKYQDQLEKTALLERQKKELMEKLKKTTKVSMKEKKALDQSIKKDLKKIEREDKIFQKQMERKLLKR